MISQHLLPNICAGEKRVLAMEIMFNTTPVAAAIRLGKMEAIDNTIVTSLADGMQSLDESVKRLLKGCQISRGDCRAIRYPWNEIVASDWAFACCVLARLGFRTFPVVTAPSQAIPAMEPCLCCLPFSASDNWDSPLSESNMRTKEDIVGNWLPRYTDTPLDGFGTYVLLTNFISYVEEFSHEPRKCRYLRTSA